MKNIFYVVFSINKVAVEIEKPQNVSNQKFLEDLRSVTSALNTDIMYSIQILKS